MLIYYTSYFKLIEQCTYMALLGLQLYSCLNNIIREKYVRNIQEKIQVIT